MVSLQGGEIVFTDTQYQSGVSCEWMLQCAPGMLATVMVEHLSTEAGYDALALFDGEDITRSPPLGVLTGEVDNGAVTSSTDSLSIRGWESVERAAAAVVLRPAARHWSRAVARPTACSTWRTARCTTSTSTETR
jgi:hypothetical protein